MSSRGEFLWRFEPVLLDTLENLGFRFYLRLTDLNARHEDGVMEIFVECDRETVV